MAKAVVAAWAACVKDLQQLVAAASASTSAPSVPDSTKDVSNLMHCMDKLSKQPPLPHAAWKKLVQDVQVPAKLAALYVQTLQQPQTLGAVLPLAYEALHAWLVKAGPAVSASPESRAAAAVRQQLQGSQLLQHLGPAMDAAAARLADAAAAVAVATKGSSSSGSAAGSFPTEQVSPQQVGFALRGEMHHSSCLLKLLMFVTPQLSPRRARSIEAALPAAPAAMRLILAVFQNYHMLPQLQLFSRHKNPLQDAYGVMLLMACGLRGDVAGTLQSCPAASELLLSPELLSCLAIMLVVAMLGLDTSSDWQEGHVPTRQEQQQQQRQQQQQADSSGSGMGRPLSNGVRLDSLTQLSCSLFDILSVTKETALQAARRAKSQGLASFGEFRMMMAGYNSVLGHQVQAKSTVTTQLLLQLETYLLLHLMLLQLTASIPDSYPGAQAARNLACRLTCDPLHSLCCAVEKRCVQLPQPTGYKGPQLALQLLPLPPGLNAVPRLPHQQQQQQQQQAKQQHPQEQEQQQQQQQQEQQQEPPDEWHLVTPSATLLTQLLPLLTRSCRTTLQQSEQQLRQQQQEGAAASLDAQLLPLVRLLMALLVCLVVPAPDSVAVTATAEGILPAPPLPLAAAAAPAVTAVATAAPAGEGHSNNDTTFRCVLHAMDAFLPHAGDIISILEGGLRLVACYAAAAAAAAAAALATAAGAAPSAAAASVAATAAADACQASAALGVYACTLFVSGLRQVDVLWGRPYHRSPLVTLALAAGPGSQVQRQLHSLLATLVKLSGWGMLGDHARLQLCAAVADAVLVLLPEAAKQQQQQQQQETDGAAAAAGEGGGGVAKLGYGSGNAASMLPSVFLLGRCCMSWAELLMVDSSLSQEQQHLQESCSKEQGEQREDPCSSQLLQQQQQEELCSSQQQQPHQQGCGNNVISKEEMAEILSVVQQWLQTGSTCDQLAAAGYATGAVLQQLEQVSAAWQNLQHTPSDAAAQLAAAQLLQSAGLALCSFAVPCMCNNPGCTSMVGLSELASVSGRSCICGGCRVARYCGRECQRAAWKQHKPLCGALGAAAGCGAG